MTAARKEFDDSAAEFQAKNRYRLKVIVGQAILIIGLLIVWHFGSGRLFDPFYVGSPTGVAKVLLADLGDSKFYRDLRVTATEMLSGYVIGAVAGIALGILFTRWRLAGDIADPFFAAFNSLPRIALAPLFVVWLGIDMAPKIVLAATLVFFITFFTTLSGIRNVDQALVNVARVIGASERQIFRYVMLPGAAAWVMNGLKMSLPYALIGVIVGEFMIASVGLGYRLNFYSTSYNTNGTFAMLLVMMALMMSLNAMMALIERYAFRWRPENPGVVQTY